MNSKILVLAPYPEESKLNDGFFQRIKKMDEFMEGSKRVYIQMSYKQFFFKKKVVHNSEVTALYLNFFLYWPILIKYALTSKVIYAHTIYNLKWIINFFKIIKAPIILDVHGTVPEEKRMGGNDNAFAKYNKIEKKCFKKIDTAIFVTKSMKLHFENKYPKYNYNTINFGIIPEHLKNESIIIDEQKLFNLKQKYDIKENNSVIIYSGGLHIWQNISLMLESISKKENDDNIIYIFLTNEPELLKKLIDEKKLSSKRIYVDSVHPSELRYYYTLSHYGFVLRDDDVVNKVANPTKLIEYMFYDIIPIVKLIDIGDFNDFGYQYITLDNYVKKELFPEKSKKNNIIVNEIFTSYKTDSIKSMFKKFLR